MVTLNELPLYHEAKYLTSAAELDQLPPDEGAELAFIGRSNAGKSSALNLITGIKGLARISKTPGRTQMINFFALNEKFRLVDLPGYGYAKVPRTIRERWEQMVEGYLRKRHCLKGLIVIMDVRHPLKEMDQAVVRWAVKCKLPVHILLTKVDKISAAAARKSLKDVQAALEKYNEKVSVELFSSLNRIGLDEAKTKLNTLFTK